MKAEFLENKNLKGIIVGGPGHTKNEFVDGNFITDQLKQKIIGMKDLSYTGEFGLQELLDKSHDILSEEDVMEEKKVMQRFFNLLAKSSGMVNYGQEHVMVDLKAGVVETVLLSEELDDKTIEDFEKEAEALGSEVVIISTDTREGVQLRDMGKVAAILRYEVQR
jgi:peptide chain release factor subunit 1